MQTLAPKSTSRASSASDLERLKKDGIVIFDQLADSATVAKIRQYLQTKPVYEWSNLNVPEESLTPLNMSELNIVRQTKLKYFARDMAQCKEVVELANNEKILSIVSAYLGCKPTIAAMAGWWTKAGTEPSGLHYDDMFHRDADDYKFAKLFVYLTDVGELNGAHCFVRGSHTSTKCTQRKAFSEAEINAAFDKSDQQIITGKSGCGILEDTWGVHRAMPCSKGERLILLFLYSLTGRNVESPPKPVAKNTFGVDSYSNRVYLYP